MLTELGKYKIAKEIDRGGMGAVYRAFDTNLGRMVALKVLSPHLGLDESFVERFRREAKMAANLRHRNIVTIYDMGSADDQYYIAMEYVEGPNLREEVRTSGRMAPQRVAAILKQLAAALDYAHDQGVIHRDIKPSNILIEAEDEVKLADFGIAKALSDSTTGLTGTQIRIGTPHYMSPEQAEGQSLNAASDIYSLGIVVYEMLAGRTPFTGATTAVLLAHISKQPPSLRALVPGLPAKVEKVVFKALEKQPQKRYQTAGEFARAFQEAVNAPVRRRAPVKLIAGIAAAFLVTGLLIALAVSGILKPAPQVTPTPMRPSPTIIVSPTRGGAATPTASRPAATSSATTRINTVTAVATATPRSLPAGGIPPTVTPISTRTPSRPTTVAPAMTRVTSTPPQASAVPPDLIAPGDGESRNGRVEFRWQEAGPLPAGAAYEVVWWRENESPVEARGFAEPVSDATLTVDLNAWYDREQVRRFYWTVIVVRRNPYARLTNLADSPSRVLAFSASCHTIIDPNTGEAKTVCD